MSQVRVTKATTGYRVQIGGQIIHAIGKDELVEMIKQAQQLVEVKANESNKY